MTWDVLLSSRAERALARIPVRNQQRVDRALLAMRDEPVSGDVAPLKGEFRGSFRRRVGSWRIVFSLKLESRAVIIHDILRRTSMTY
jgi:mRNA-degrading endonuclease RelE of RelBE toxin-antitoxin system